MDNIRLFTSFLIGLVLVLGSTTRLFGFSPMGLFELPMVPIWVAILVFFVGLFLMFPERTATIYMALKDRLPSFSQK